MMNMTHRIIQTKFHFDTILDYKKVFYKTQDVKNAEVKEEKRKLYLMMELVLGVNANGVKELDM